MALYTYGSWVGTEVGGFPRYKPGWEGGRKGGSRVENLEFETQCGEN